jgi:hypothetical protein
MIEACQMAEHLDKRGKRGILKQWKAEQRAVARAKLPFANDQMKALFDTLDAELSRRGCDKTLRIVREWCEQNGTEFVPVEAWLFENGGGCDCEALANSEQAWLEAITDESAKMNDPDSPGPDGVASTCSR